MEEHPALYVVPQPAYIQRMKDEAAAFRILCIRSALDAVPERDLERLRQQLTPLAKRPCIAEDRHEFTRIIHEWNMRGLPDFAPTMVFDLLYDEHSAERKAMNAPRRQRLRERFPEMYAALDPGLHIVPRTSEEASGSIARVVDYFVLRSLGQSSAARKLIAFLRGTAPRQ
jgi:hypothetical protein